jgi:hypothetical protein
MSRAKKDFSSMDSFWKEFGARLGQNVPDTNIAEFEIKNDLKGFRIDRVVQGKKGVDVRTLLRICTALDLSPTWLMFGKGRKSLSELRFPLVAQGLIDEFVAGLDQLGYHRLITDWVKQQIFNFTDEGIRDAKKRTTTRTAQDVPADHDGEVAAPPERVLPGAAATGKGIDPRGKRRSK